MTRAEKREEKKLNRAFKLNCPKGQPVKPRKKFKNPDYNFENYQIKRFLESITRTPPKSPFLRELLANF